MPFSATMPDPIITLARTFMNQPTHIRAESAQSRRPTTPPSSSSTARTRWTRVEMVVRILQADGVAAPP